MAARSRTLLTPEEYFAHEEAAEGRSEYFHGELLAISGGSANHSRLQRNLTRLLDSQLTGRACELFTSDLRLEIGAAGVYTYPDLSVVCGALDIDAHHNLRNPTLLIEVLSPSTEAYDRGRKFLLYRQLPSLRQYLLVAQDEPLLELFSRLPDGSWKLETFTATATVVRLESLGCGLELAEVYRGVKLEAEGGRA